MKTRQQIEKFCSGVIHIKFLINNEIIGSGTGFMSDEHLITNNHVFIGACESTHVKLSWQETLNPKTKKEITLQSNKFKSFLKSGSHESNYDYAILSIPELQNKNLFNFSLSSPKSSHILDECLVLGFPLEHENLVFHKAIISSFFTSNKTNKIQLDASINASNSGGPLVNLKDSKVIGIVTRKNTGLSILFNQFIEILNNNIKNLNQITPRFTLGQFDPVQAFIINQHQLLGLAKEIQRSANTGIGYAFSIEYVQNELENLLK